jgi:hypothetical protein
VEIFCATRAPPSTADFLFFSRRAAGPPAAVKSIAAFDNYYIHRHNSPPLYYQPPLMSHLSPPFLLLSSSITCRCYIFIIAAITRLSCQLPQLYYFIITPSSLSNAPNFVSF